MMPAMAADGGPTARHYQAYSGKELGPDGTMLRLPTYKAMRGDFKVKITFSHSVDEGSGVTAF